MVSKLSFQAFPTAVNIYAAYEHHNKHGAAGVYSFRSTFNIAKTIAPNNRTIFRTKRNLLALGDKRPAFVCFIGSGIGLSLSMPPL